MPGFRTRPSALLPILLSALLAALAMAVPPSVEAHGVRVDGRARGALGAPDGETIGPDAQPDAALTPDGAGSLPQFLGPSDTLATYQVVDVYSGTMRSTVVISNPEGITGIEAYESANFSQRILSQSFDRVELEITNVRELATSAPFPVDRGALPPEALEWLIPRPQWIQSDDPTIVSTAQAITASARLQAEAVDAIIAWVRGHLVYDYLGPRDALAVYESGSAYCVGFANLAMALLRAVNIPARAQYGTVGAWDGWGSPVEGGRHTWVEVYYPDVGWVGCDPQASANMLDTAHIVGFLDQSGKPGTVVQRVAHEGSLSTQDPGFLYSLRTPFTTRTGMPVYSASVPAWDRHPLSVAPTQVAVRVSPLSPVRSIDVNVEARDVILAAWHVETGAAWLRPNVAASAAPGTLRVDVDGTGMPPGTHVGTLDVVADEVVGAPAAARTVTVTLEVDGVSSNVLDPGPGDAPHRVALPMVIGRH